MGNSNSTIPIKELNFKYYKVHDHTNCINQIRCNELYEKHYYNKTNFIYDGFSGGIIGATAGSVFEIYKIYKPNTVELFEKNRHKRIMYCSMSGTFITLSISLLCSDYFYSKFDPEYYIKE